ncbi:hypothetical protein Cgig2_001953 [Carnegiea gigantea]|uniref:Uncharacterized protein n=1 Tax=Carnegiea gigantea TaxID=171969 RepID=A0A9Q1K0X4_9CARY|nr:hypothetical protein Cgig2_001953 [Carnegiea gigantea]
MYECRRKGKALQQESAIVNNLTKQHLEVLFKIITFMDKTSGRRYLHIQPSRKGKPTIEQFIAFWFRGHNKYHVSRKFDQENRTPHLGTLSPIIDAGARGWLEMLAAYALALASYMALCVGYCLPTTILASIYKRLSAISRSSHLGRSGGHVHTRFLYAWLAKNFDAYELAAEASFNPSMRPQNSLVLGGVFAGIYPSSTDSRRFSWMKASYRELTLLDLSALYNLVKEHYYPDQLVDNLVSIRMFLLMWTSIIFLIWKQCFVITTCSRAMEWGLKSYILGDAIYLRETPLVHFVNGGPRCSFPQLTIHMPVIPRGNEDEGKLGFKPKLKIVCSRKPLEPFVLPMEDDSSHDELLIRVYKPSIEKVIELPLDGAENIMCILDAEPNPTECDLFDNQSRLVDLQGVCSLDDREVKSISRANAPSLVPHPQCPLRAPQGGISVFNDDAVINEVDKKVARVFGKAILDKVSHTPFDGLPPLKGDFDSLYATSFQRSVDVTPLKSKVEGLIKQAFEIKDLQQSYIGRTFVEEHNSCRMEEVVDLWGQIDILNATEVMDAATKASIDKVIASIKESFKDLKNF